MPVAVLNVDYRVKGGYPGPFLDAAAALDVVVDERVGQYGLNSEQVVVVGHSAGGTLAYWAAMRGLLPSDAPGAMAPRVVPRGAVSLGGVLDLTLAADDLAQVGASAVRDLMHGQASDSSRIAQDYRAASPINMLPPAMQTELRSELVRTRSLTPLDCIFTAIHGEDDQLVAVEQSARFVVAATVAGMEVELVRVGGEGHMECLDPRSASWGLAKVRSRSGSQSSVLLLHVHASPPHLHTPRPPSRGLSSRGTRYLGTAQARLRGNGGNRDEGRDAPAGGTMRVGVSTIST